MLQILRPCSIGGELHAVPSKSFAQRAMLCAALAERPTTFVCRTLPLDVEAMLRCLTALGAEVTRGCGTLTLRPPELPQGDATLDCGESGATARFLLPVVAALGIGARLLLRGSLAARPMQPLLEALSAGGCNITSENGVISCEGKLRSGRYLLPGNVSSQYISGLLFALPLLRGDSEIVLSSPLESKDYVNLTIDLLSRFSVRVEQTQSGFFVSGGQSYRACGRMEMEGDWSAMSLFLCAGAFSAPMRISGLPAQTQQPDRRITDILRDFGAHVHCDGGVRCVSPAELHSLEIDAHDIPDLVPALALTATAARGRTRIFGASRLRYKESNRLQSICTTLRALGAQISETDDGLLIYGTPLVGGEIDPQNDHRIAMLAAVASARCRQEVRVRHAECVDKSYPDFWRDLRRAAKEAHP